MANYRIALFVKNPMSSGEEFLVIRENRPSAIPVDDDEHGHHRYADSDLWDIPSAALSRHSTNTQFDPASQTVVQDVQHALQKLELCGFDLSSAVQQIFMQICAGKCMTKPWIYWKSFEEADFGPSLPIHTMFFIADIEADEFILSEGSKWLSFSEAWRLLVNVNPRDDRLGPLAAFVSCSYFGESLKSKLSIKSQCQEYPPGVLIVPMSSLTVKPFKKTNLVVFAPDNRSDIGYHDSKFAAYADALIMDPGCHYKVHDQLAEIVTSLPRKLVIFVTHHHRDHVDGLSVVKRCNPNVTLLAHEATIRRIAKGATGIKCINVQGGSTLCIGGQEFQVIFAPGHTDGHMALLHVNTHTLVVGDHCVGQGSSVLDVESGGNMKDYLETTHQFLELSPHVIIPMHGRPNLWPTKLLCGYIKHRKERETKVLKAIESGATTLYEVVSNAYTDVLPVMWVGAASNVRLHVEHLAYQQKLPEDFSMDTFLTSCGRCFLLRWLWATLQNKAHKNSYLNFAVKLSPVLIAGLASYMFIYFGNKQNSS